MVQRSAPRRRRDTLWLVIDTILLYPILVLATVLCTVIFRGFNRLRVRGVNPGLQSKLMIVSNHQSLVDSFLVSGVLCLPEILWRPNLAPYHLADGKNFFTHPFLRHIYRILRAIPVGRTANGDRRDWNAFTGAVNAVRAGGVLHVFIEGTRSTDEELQLPKSAVGSISLLSGATIRPVYLTGMHAVQPYRKAPGDPPATWLRLFGARTEWLLDLRAGKDITVVIGEDMTPDEIVQLAGQGSHREQATRVAAAVMARIHALKAQIDAPPNLLNSAASG